MVEILIGCKYCVKHFNDKILKYFLVGQAVLQMRQISRSCANVSMGY